MNRKTFLRTTGLAAAGMLAAPYILPSGRLFAATGARKVDHVVFCLFAGGVRNFESIQKAEGNLMPNILLGNESISPDIAAAMTPLPAPTGTRLQTLGTLYKQFRYTSGPTGHFNGHTVAMTGRYTETDLNLRTNPLYPTVFEYYRKHNSPEQTALKAWWVSNALGPYPSLNYSQYPGYGALYGANFIQPLSLVNSQVFTALGNPKVFSVADEQRINSMRTLLDNNFHQTQSGGDAGVVNGTSEREQLQSFVSSLYQSAQQGEFNNLLNSGVTNGGGFNDLFNIAIAEKVISQFSPELLVVNMQGVDICHSNFTSYCDIMRIADYGVRHLWNHIQNTAGMANNTVLIIAPEHGRNLQPNTIQDQFGRFAIDHTGDPTSREIFCLVIGPSNVVVQNQVINTVTGESIDIVPTIAHLLGFDSAIPAGMLPGQVLHHSLV